MTESNHSALNSGVKLYTDAMRRLVRERLSDVFGSDWWERGVLEAMDRQQRKNLERDRRKNPDTDIVDLLDAQDFEPIVDENFDTAFKGVFPHFARTRPRMLEAGQARNRWAHPPSGDMNTDEVANALYVMAQVLGTARLPEAGDVEAIRKQVMDGTQPETPVVVRQPWPVRRGGGKGARLAAFFQGLGDRLHREGFTGPRNAGRDNWMSFPTEVYGVAYWAWLAVGDEAKVVLVLEDTDRETNKARFDWLLRQKESIEHELGEPLIWDRKNRYKSSHIYVARPNSSVYADEQTLQAIQDWMSRELHAFGRVFGRRLAQGRR